MGAAAGPSEVLVSQTVKDLVAGWGLEFEDRGQHELRASTAAGASIGSLARAAQAQLLIHMQLPSSGSFMVGAPAPQDLP